MFLFYKVLAFQRLLTLITSEIHLLLASHERVDGDAAVEAGAGDDGRVARAPRHVEAPLCRRGQLADDLLPHRGRVGVPAEDAVVLATGEEQVGVLLAPGHGEDAPLKN